MEYTVAAFCQDARETLKTTPGPDGREKVRRLLERLLSDQAIIAQYFGPDAKPGIRTVHRCDETGFNFLIHVYENGKSGPPHDHGNSWAIYGQAVGTTRMGIWKRLDDGSRHGRADIEKQRELRLDPGMARKFEPHEIHSIEISDGSRFVRVTGADLNTVETMVFNPATRTVAPGNRL